MLTIDDVRELLRKACEQAGNQNRWAKAHGISRGNLTAVLKGRKDPGDQFLKALHLVKVVSFQADPAYQPDYLP